MILLRQLACLFLDFLANLVLEVRFRNQVLRPLLWIGLCSVDSSSAYLSGGISGCCSVCFVSFWFGSWLFFFRGARFHSGMQQIFQGLAVITARLDAADIAWGNVASPSAPPPPVAPSGVRPVSSGRALSVSEVRDVFWGRFFSSFW